MSNFIDFLLVISKLQSPIYCPSPQLDPPEKKYLFRLEYQYMHFLLEIAYCLPRNSTRFL